MILLEMTFQTGSYAASERLATILRDSLGPYTYSATKCYTPPKTPDESGNYNHPMRVTYRYEISITNHAEAIEKIADRSLQLETF